MSDNWVVQNLENALEVWNDKLSEIWQLITQSPQTFKGGSIWSIICSIHGALQAIGYALLVLFFVVGVVKTCGSFAELKKPEHAVKLFVRFAIAKGLITYGMELMMAILEIIQGVVSTIMNSAGFGSPQATVLPQEIITAVEDCGFFESIPLWAVTLIGGLFIWVLSFVMILSVYGRFFKMYMYTALAPVPLSTFAGEPTQNIGKSFLSENRRYQEVMLQYRCALKALESRLEILNEEFSLQHDRNPIESMKSRLKSPSSIMNKMQKRGLPLDFPTMQANIMDIAGVRVICSFEEDVFFLAKCLKNQSDIEIITEKDYISHPKPNGYRSLHLTIRLPVFFAEKEIHVPVEIQLRTIAMDFWASLEHTIRYKKNLPINAEIETELKECADSSREWNTKMERLLHLMR